MIVLSAATANLVTAAIHAAISRAPGWKIARVISLIAFTGGLYNVLSAITCLFHPLSAADFLTVCKLAYVMAMLHAGAWVVYAYGGQEGSVRGVPRNVRYLLFAIVAVGVLLTLTNSIFETQITAVDFDWANRHYWYPKVTTAGALHILMLVGLIGLAFVGLAQRVRRGERSLRWQLVFFLLFFVCVIDEILVLTHVITFFPLGDLGIALVVFPLTLRVVSQLIGDARRLDALSARLAGEVVRRTAERDDAEQKLIDAEGLVALGRLAAGVGHEINNPLTYLQLALEELTERLGPMAEEPEVSAPLVAAKDGAFRIQKVVEGLRAYSRQQDERAPVDLHDIVRAAMNVAGPRLRHLAPLQTELEPVPLVLGDEPRLVQALVNLLVNAAQAVADKGSGTVKVSTSVGPEGRVLLKVSDDGNGISRENLERLSEPYFTTRAKSGGMGLGLFVTRGIVSSHDGTLSFESKPGRGTEVTIELPSLSEAAVAKSEEVRAEGPRGSSASVGREAPAARSSGGRASSGRLLLLDDEPLILGMLGRVLKRRWQVTCLEESREALELLSRPEVDFDVVICDLMMPGISGMELADELERLRPDLRKRMLFLTGGAVTATAEAFLQREDVRYLEKPVDVAELELVLDELRVVRPELVAEGEGV